ncbi:MAG: O-antigen/teichoic acid export membrane protein [Cyclobacteriaceae bacterium]|jgi:O-antigen/teichoic acid export membrane protein
MIDKIKHLLDKDNIIVLLGNVGSSALGLFIFMILARILEPSDFGSWALFISFSGLFEIIKTGLIRQALVHKLNDSNTFLQNELLASARLINLLLSIFLAIIVFIGGYLVDDLSFNLFFDYYPFLVIVTSAQQFDTWKSHALGKFVRMNVIRFGLNFFFLAFLTITYFWEELANIQSIILAYLVINACISLLSWITSNRHHGLIQATKTSSNALLQFGKSSVATLAGANLLKSADNIIIGLLLGTEAIAIYAIPLKAMDLLEIPLRGFSMTAFRKLSNLHHSHEYSKFKTLFRQNVAMLSLAFLPVGLFIFIFPNFVINILSGAQYGESAGLMMLFVIPMILLPIDKFTGLALDALNKPHINATKVWIMVAINIIGDCVVIYLFDSLYLVALVTVINIIAGILFGLISLRKINHQLTMA